MLQPDFFSSLAASVRLAAVQRWTEEVAEIANHIRFYPLRRGLLVESFLQWAIGVGKKLAEYSLDAIY